MKEMLFSIVWNIIHCSNQSTCWLPKWWANPNWHLVCITMQSFRNEICVYHGANFVDYHSIHAPVNLALKSTVTTQSDKCSYFIVNIYSLSLWAASFRHRKSLKSNSPIKHCNVESNRRPFLSALSCKTDAILIQNNSMINSGHNVKQC